MNDNQLRSFLTVAECGSFSKAEEGSFLSKQALIKQIDALEDELGFRLLSRGKKGVKLTAAGKEFYAGAQEMLRLYESVTERCRKLAEKREVIRIANPPHTRLMLGDAMVEFSKRCPDVHLEIVYRTGAQAIEDIISGAVDVGEHTLTEEVERPELAYTKISVMRYYCVMQASHPLAEYREICPEQLSGCTVGIMRDNQKELAALLRQKCSSVDIREQSSAESHAAAVYNICFSGGVYITKDYYAASLQPLRAIPLAAEVNKERVIVYRRDPSPEVRRFVELVQEMNRE